MAEHAGAAHCSLIAHFVPIIRMTRAALRYSARCTPERNTSYLMVKMFTEFRVRVTTDLNPVDPESSEIERGIFRNYCSVIFSAARNSGKLDGVS
jgi:hypothetical protein